MSLTPKIGMRGMLRFIMASFKTSMCSLTQLINTWQELCIFLLPQKAKTFEFLLTYTKKFTRNH